MWRSPNHLYHNPLYIVSTHQYLVLNVVCSNVRNKVQLCSVSNSWSWLSYIGNSVTSRRLHSVEEWQRQMLCPWNYHHSGKLSPLCAFYKHKSQFHMTVETPKYYFVVSALEQCTPSRILYVLQSPPTTNICFREDETTWLPSASIATRAIGIQESISKIFVTVSHQNWWRDTFPPGWPRFAIYMSKYS